MLRTFALLQVIGSFAVLGILTQDVSSPSSTVRTMRRSNKLTNWQTILRDATFQSLIKHTGFTPSLDQKIETDRLLWEKIQAAKFLRKHGKVEDIDKMKTGVLVDMTPENGQLEFRQTDRSLYNCPEEKCKPVFNRLLAVWRIQKFEPNDIWIRIKVPKHNSNSEDVYEYTPKLGLKQLQLADPFYSTKTKLPNKHNVWKSGDDVRLIALDERSEDIIDTSEASISRQDSRFFDMHELMRQLLTKQRSYQKPKQLSTIHSSNPRYVPHIIGLSVPPQPVPKDYDWKEGGTYYQVKPINILAEFKTTDQVYDGFMPSIGPTGTPPVYQSTLSQPISFQEVFPKYESEYQNPQKLVTTMPSDFKPSIEFIHYSELDPFYHEDEGDKFITITTTRPLKSEKDGKINLFPTSINEQLPEYNFETNSTVEETPKGQSSDNINTQPTASSINILHVTEKEGKIIFTTNDLSKIRTPTTNKPNLQNKGVTRNNLISKITSAETYDYAPLYVKWGEKIKSVTNKTKTDFLKPTLNLNLKTINSKNIPQDITREKLETKEIINNSTNVNSWQNTIKNGQIEIIAEDVAKSFNGSVAINNTTTAELNSKNVHIDNINDKSPEEIVNTLTNIGVHNTTRVEGYPEISEKVLENSNKLIDKLTENNDQISDNTDPISIVINRISQSFSYKTSNGKIRSIKHDFNKNQLI